MDTSELQLIRPRQLCELLDIHISTLYRLLDEGKLPLDKVQIGPRAVGFKASQVKKYINGELEKEPQKEVQ